ncbi:hypothetical protein [Peptoniphilus sp. oral taxon 386]|uniref:hypothetical protein n=1 Tax=Peptoniphilus sp. oral taxon 386 TaxID=652713 RepID=UPI0001DAA47F|nr:hypothetical protein [Peptoniphilus sp. oral taxon 386]EFI41368.1 hypothetical protein HMPREF0629_01427 [Peptoniphilus sp. oral taxon 386 str. F0131]
MNINIWRLHTNTDNQTNYSISDYCIENNILALGWSLNDDHLKGKGSIDKLIKERQLIGRGTEEESFNKYVNFVKNNEIYENINNINRLKKDIKPYDLVWMRKGGIYWLGLVGENSRYLFNSSEESLEMDASNQRTDIKWFEIGGESDVAGAITTSFIRGNTLQRIKQNGIIEFSKYLINVLHEPIYEIEKLDKSPRVLFNLISPNDCEDLVCIWLYKKYGYFTIPSTCKKSTQLYECVLINPENTDKKEVYIQVKKGSVDLDCSDYNNLNGEIWLFTTNGKIIGQKRENMNTIDAETIYEFAMNCKNDNLLPSKIIKWRNLLEGNLKL